MQYMNDFAARLEGTGEFVDGQALSPEGTLVRYDGEGRPPVTDGPFAETKDLIAGWMVIDVDSYERARRAGRRAVGGAGGGWQADPRVARGAPVPDRATDHHRVTRVTGWTRPCCASLIPSVTRRPRPPRSRLRGGRGRGAGRAGRGGARLAGRPAAGPQGLAGHRRLAQVPRRRPGPIPPAAGARTLVDERAGRPGPGHASTTRSSCTSCAPTRR